MQKAQITALTIYPVKSMKGIPLQSAVLTPEGLENDRRFMVVRSNGRFLTQRDLPRLALIETSLNEDGVELSMDGQGPVLVPFKAAEGERIDTKVWGDECETVDAGEEISTWLTDALQSKDRLRLVRMAPEFARPQSQPEKLGGQTHTFFADLAPFLVANEASLAALNQELEVRGHSPVPMNRFRPNIVVQGIAPFAEHRVATFESGNYALKFCHPCERCVVTTIDQATAEKNPDWQPFRTLREINPAPGKKPTPLFGQNAILEKGNRAIVSLGDQLLDLSDT